MKNETNVKRTKSYSVLIVGAVLLIVSLIFTVHAHSTSYQDSLVTASELSQVKEQISAIEDETSTGDLDALNEQKATLSADKLSKERPYSFGLTATFLSILIVLKGLYNALRGVASVNKANIKSLTQAGLMAALSYVGFAFLRIDLPMGHTAFHFGNVFVVLAALLLGGYWGGLAGAIGLTIADLTTAYVTSAPKTFLLKLCIGLIVGLIAHNVFKLSRPHPAKYVTGVTILAATCGMAFNIIADPLVGYFYKTYLLGVPQDLAATFAKIDLGATAVNAVVAVVAASIFYLALRPAMKSAGLLIQVSPEETPAEK